MTDFKTWIDAQQGEANFWKNFVNTLAEEEKQLFYAKKMCIYLDGDYRVDLFNRSFLDIGSNAISLLLRGYNGGKQTVVDPIEIPKWAIDRYKSAGIEYVRQKAEDFKPGKYDEVWIYNVLQHVQDPEKVIAMAKKAAPCLRIFEWLGEPSNEEAKKLHPNVLTEKALNGWIGQSGRVETVIQQLLKGDYYYGVFIL